MKVKDMVVGEIHNKFYHPVYGIINFIEKQKKSEKTSQIEEIRGKILINLRLIITI